ncbi:TIGR02281 family clan AA aspartic protease [Sphingomonas sp.]|uniref:retropepsin-like aspartic protease family protein n=1 Tax=Sphingomonas sp. TaxID=28214 RepID=UPI001B1E4AC6|nr:TIGR02281 family clan AA aspartic protease [Sphingomonas sp.]MBO9711902.1 TIGR02281 family clan AA aspartic protease [Sphingomonas sp.]
MSGDALANLAWLSVALVLAAASLRGRDIGLKTVVRGVLGWAAVALVVTLIVVHRYEIGAAFGRATAMLGLDEQQSAGGTMRIRQSPDGHFWARVSINGVERPMLIDSGATTTALSEETARLAGIQTGGMPTMLDTANGTIFAKRGSARAVALGSIRTQDLDVVVAPNFGDGDALGMNFLSRLKSWRVEQNVLVLEPQDGPN